MIYLVAVIAVAGFLLWSRRDDLGALTDGTRPAWLVAALAMGFVQLLLSSVFWSAALAAVGERPAYGAVLSASSRSLLARYVPGSVWYAVGRSALLSREQGISRRSLAVVAAMETGLTPVVGAAFGVGLLLGGGRIPGGGISVVLWCALLAVTCSPPVVNAVLRLAARRLGGEARRIGWASFAGLVAWQALFWVSAATMFGLYLHAFPGLDLPSVTELGGSFMVAWVIGFLAIFAPQGLGVFEATVAGLLTDQSLANVAILVGGYRALTLVRDLLAVAWSETQHRRTRTANGHPRE